MRGQRAAIVLASASVVVGAAFALHGTATDRATTFRTGLVALLVGLVGVADARQRLNVQRLMEHQTRTATLAMQERQRYAELGWKAAKIDALSEETPEFAGDAQVVNLPVARSASSARKKGSAS